jgi:hypothetical protein
MADTRPLLKGFGALADVAGQIATDKAVNSRRQRPSNIDIASGVAVPVTLRSGIQWYPHGLGRTPVGALVMLKPPVQQLDVIGLRRDAIQIQSDTNQAPQYQTYLWVF